jgi:hypothetical protein
MLKERKMSKATIPTYYLLGYVMCALAALDISKQTKFFTMISSHLGPWLRGIAGWCFEKFVLVQLIAHLSKQKRMLSSVVHSTGTGSRYRFGYL